MSEPHGEKSLANHGKRGPFLAGVTERSHNLSEATQAFYASVSVQSWRVVRDATEQPAQIARQVIASETMPAPAPTPETPTPETSIPETVPTKVPAGLSGPAIRRLIDQQPTQASSDPVAQARNQVDASLVSNLAQTSAVDTTRPYDFVTEHPRVEAQVPQTVPSAQSVENPAYASIGATSLDEKFARMGWTQLTNPAHLDEEAQNVSV